MSANASSPRPEPLLSPEIEAAIAKIDADCRFQSALAKTPCEPATIYAILAETPEDGTDLSAAMSNAMYGSGYLLSHERRLLAITLARALPEIASLRSRLEAAEARIAASPLPSDAGLSSEPTNQQCYEELLAKKLAWFEESAKIHFARHGDVSSVDLADTLREIRHFAPSAMHWALDVAASRLSLAEARCGALEADATCPECSHPVARHAPFGCSHETSHISVCGCRARLAAGADPRLIPARASHPFTPRE